MLVHLLEIKFEMIVVSKFEIMENNFLIVFDYVLHIS